MENIAIFIDSLSTLQAPNSADPHQMIQGLHSSLAKLTAQFPVTLHWVPAHVGLTGNETSDFQISVVRLCRHRTLSPTKRSRHFYIHSSKETGRKTTVATRAYPDQIWRLEWAQQTTIFHLYMGLCGLSAHLKRTGISDSCLCECGQTDQTPDHFLQSCPKYAKRRQLTWGHGADLVTKIWDSAEDLYQTAGFVASTELKI